MSLDCIVKPAGLRAPPVKRDFLQQKNNLQPILEVFEEYKEQMKVGMWEFNFNLATKLTQSLVLPDQSSIDAFINLHQDEAIIADHKTGLFISALYNKTEQGVITYEHELPINFLGYRMTKTLIVNGSAGKYYGLGSSGLVVVNGSAGNNCGWWSSGLVVVNGSAGDYCGYGSSGLVVVNGTARDHCGDSSSGVVVETLKEGVKTWSIQGSGTKIPYTSLVQNPALHKYIQTLITPFTNRSLSTEELQKLSLPDVKSAMAKIKRLYKP